MQGLGGAEIADEEAPLGEAAVGAVGGANPEDESRVASCSLRCVATTNGGLALAVEENDESVLCDVSESLPDSTRFLSTLDRRITGASPSTVGPTSAAPSTSS